MFTQKIYDRFVAYLVIFWYVFFFQKYATLYSFCTLYLFCTEILNSIIWYYFISLR